MNVIWYYHSHNSLNYAPLVIVSDKLIVLLDVVFVVLRDRSSHDMRLMQIVVNLPPCGWEFSSPQRPP